MAITKESIIETAEQLLASGVTPTQINIREALGGGSFATIGPILKAWKEAAKEDQAFADVPVPDAIEDRLDQLKGALWQTAIQEADRRLESERTALAEAHQKAISDSEEAAEAIRILEAEQEDLKNELAQSNAKLRSAQEQLATQKEQMSAAQADFSQQLSQKTAEIESQKATVTELRAALDKSETRTETVEGKLEVQQKQQQTEIEGIRNSHKAEIDELKKDHRENLATEVRKSEQLEKENKRLGLASEHAQARLEGAQSEIEQLRSGTTKMTEKLSTAQQEAAELRGELKSLRETATSKKKS